MSEKGAIGKTLAAERALDFVKDGMIVGLGTGSTAEIFVRKLAERVKAEGFEVHCVPTSQKTAALARALGLKVIEIEENTEIDITVDGADEVSPELNLIKGMGGALLWEKIVAKMSRKECIVVDASKVVNVLGERTPVPVEVVPYGWRKTRQIVETKFGCRADLRKRGEEVFRTDSGNYILDCKFGRIEKPELLEREIKATTGIVESGLFCGIATTVIVGDENGETREMERQKPT
ncbi:MAG: ribose 5-phosphate isomerase A [Thermoplasmata archaeon]|nr:ribose 5-phosphate isomerase A [Thermoplasmata archaeon]